MFKSLFKSQPEEGKAEKIQWIPLLKAETLQDIKSSSHDQKILIFKHSTRCSISSSALHRLERAWNQAEMQAYIQPYFLDLIQYRAISNQIEQEFGVEHQSPQAIIISKGKAIYDASHMGINYEEIAEIAKK